MQPYKYEVAFSLCKQDIDFAKELKTKLNPGLQDKIFLYTERQEELISKIGVEEFRNVFLIQSRVVVIIYRKEYGNSHFTQLEKEAIIERISNRDDGYNFIYMIPMIKGENPTWYPSTRIYADPFDYSVLDLAKFLEFKITERDGLIKPIKFEDIVYSFKNDLISKQKKINDLSSPESLILIKNELDKIRKCFNKQYDFFSKMSLPFTLMHYDNSNNMNIGIGNFILEISIEDNEKIRLRNISSSNFRLRTSIFTKAKYEYVNIGTPKPFLDQRFYRFNIDGQNIYGWSEEINYGSIVEHSITPYLFHDYIENYQYDLIKFHSSETLIDTLFSLLFYYAKQEFELIK